jgi:hypothetical protein
MADVAEHDHIPMPIALQRCRELLGVEAIDLSDDEVDKIRRHAQSMAHLLIELAECQGLRG